MMIDFEGKIALVTGAGSGIGRAIACAFGQRNAVVVVADINADNGNETVGIITQTGGNAIFVQSDVAQSRSVENLVGEAVKKFGRLDIAVNNAGIVAQPPTLTADYPEDMWDRVYAVNLKGVFLCMKNEIRQMFKQGGGAIVNIASVNAIVGNIGDCAYAATKHGVAGLTKTAAMEYAKSNIRVNAVCPGIVETAITDELRNISKGHFEEFALRFTPMGRLGRPEEIAGAAIWLCSDAASFTTGTIMTVDGGFTSH